MCNNILVHQTRRATHLKVYFQNNPWSKILQIKNNCFKNQLLNISIPLSKILILKILFDAFLDFLKMCTFSKILGVGSHGWNILRGFLLDFSPTLCVWSYTRDNLKSIQNTLKYHNCLLLCSLKRLNGQGLKIFDILKENSSWAPYE